MSDDRSRGLGDERDDVPRRGGDLAPHIIIALAIVFFAVVLTALVETLG